MPSYYQQDDTEFHKNLMANVVKQQLAKQKQPGADPLNALQNMINAARNGSVPAGGYEVSVPDSPAATAPKPVPNQQPVAGPVAAGPMVAPNRGMAPVPGAPVAGPPALTTVNDSVGRKAMLDQQINTILKTKVLGVPLGTPGRDEAVNYVKMLKAERDAVGASVPNLPKFLAPNDWEAKQQQMYNIQRAELMRRQAAAAQPMSGADQDRATMNAGKMELWRRGMGDAVLRDTSGELQRTAGSQFNSQQYVQSGGAYGTPGEKAINADQIRRNQEAEQIRAQLAEIDRGEADLKSGKAKADYIARQGQRDAATQMAQARAAAAGAEADRMKSQRDLATQNQMDEATMAKRQREIAMKMQEIELEKAKAGLLTAKSTGEIAPVIAKNQAERALSSEFYKSLGTTDLPTLRDSAMKDWDTSISPYLGGSVNARNEIGVGQTPDPRAAQFWINKYIAPLERAASINPAEARAAAAAIREAMPFGGIKARDYGTFDGLVKALQSSLGIADYQPEAQAFLNLMARAYERLSKIADGQ